MAITATPINGDCFIIMPITVPDHLLEIYAGDGDHFDHVYKHLFKPAVMFAGFKPLPPSSDGSRVIHRDIAEKLQNANMVLCDMSALNPNVFFELGMRTAMNKPVCLVRDTALPKLPFDTGPIQCHLYDSNPVWDIEDQRMKLTGHLAATAKTGEYKDGKNAWWQVMGVDYTPATIDAGGDPSDLTPLKLEQIISMLDTMRTPENPAPHLYKIPKVINRLIQYLPTDIRCSWQTDGPDRLSLTLFQDLSFSTQHKLRIVAIDMGVSLIIHEYSPGESEDADTEPTDE